MKKLFLLFLFTGFLCYSQHRKEIYASYKDLGYHKQPKKVSIIHYEFSDKVAIDQAKETYLFDEAGNITSIIEVNYIDNNAEIKTIFDYRKGLLVKECNQLPEKKHLQRCTNYDYNPKNQLIKKVLKAEDNYTETTIYTYKDNRLAKIEVDFDSDSNLVQELFYDSKGELYLVKSTEIVPTGKKYISTDAYLKDKLLFQRDHDNDNTFLYHTENNMEIQFLVKGAKTLKTLKQLEERLAKEDAAVSKDFSFLINENFQKDSEMKVNNITVFKRNENKDIIATAITNKPKNPLETIQFLEIEYADGTVSGKADFDIFIYNELNRMK